MTSLDTAVNNPLGPEALRRSGDLYMMAACVLCAGVALAIGWRFDQVGFAAALSSALLLVAAGLFVTARGTLLNSVALPVLVSSFVALHIHLGTGRSEYHFGVFVAVSAMLVYRHWLPIVATTAAFAVHHLLFDRLQALGFPVFCQTQADFAGVLVHAGYLVVQAVFSVFIALRMRQDARLAAELDFITRGLTRQEGKVDFSGLAFEPRTAAGQSLQGVLAQIRDATGTARAAAESVNTVSAEIAVGNEDLSHRTERTAADLQRTAAAVDELNASASAQAQSAQEAARIAHEAAGHVTRAEACADELGLSMQKLLASSKRVVDITSVIDSIAFQTNILALNAAVEAARAGEQGRGFAVVASEVRSLAGRSAAAAKEIKTLLLQTSEEVDEGVSVAQATRADMGQIAHAVQRVHVLLSEIAVAATEQSKGLEHVNSAVTSLDQATQQNAALVEQSSAATVSLQEQARGLASTMRAFELGAPSRENAHSGARSPFPGLVHA